MQPRQTISFLRLLKNASSPWPSEISSKNSIVTLSVSPLIQRGSCQTMATAATKQQPPWEPPPPADSNAKLPPLKIWNSLTRSKTPFVPIDWRNKTVSWYACGPTVYDDAHLGHARNYVSTDILRRVMRDYFKFNVTFVMNITDVDDKVCDWKDLNPHNKPPPPFAASSFVRLD